MGYDPSTDEARPTPPQTEHIPLCPTLEAVDDHDKKPNFSIVGEHEADAPKPRISWLSPLGKPLIGAREGDSVIWRRPAGDLELEVAKISYR